MQSFAHKTAPEANYTMRAIAVPAGKIILYFNAHN